MINYKISPSLNTFKNYFKEKKTCGYISLKRSRNVFALLLYFFTITHLILDTYNKLYNFNLYKRVSEELLLPYLKTLFPWDKELGIFQRKAEEFVKKKIRINNKEESLNIFRTITEGLIESYKETNNILSNKMVKNLIATEEKILVLKNDYEFNDYYQMSTLSESLRVAEIISLISFKPMSLLGKQEEEEEKKKGLKSNNNFNDIKRKMLIELKYDLWDYSKNPQIYSYNEEKKKLEAIELKCRRITEDKSGIMELVLPSSTGPDIKSSTDPDINQDYKCNYYIFEKEMIKNIYDHLKRAGELFNSMKDIPNSKENHQRIQNYREVFFNNILLALKELIVERLSSIQEDIQNIQSSSEIILDDEGKEYYSNIGKKLEEEIKKIRKENEEIEDKIVETLIKNYFNYKTKEIFPLADSLNEKILQRIKEYPEISRGDGKENEFHRLESEETILLKLSRNNNILYLWKAISLSSAIIIVYSFSSEKTLAIHLIVLSIIISLHFLNPNVFAELTKFYKEKYNVVYSKYFRKNDKTNSENNIIEYEEYNVDPQNTQLEQ